MISEKLTQLVAVSNRYGGDADYVLAGGGNTSFKDGGVMYVKASGTSLADITADRFVAMDMSKLSDMLNKAYPEEDEAREAAALADMMAARLPGEEDKRPSVEAILHGLFPYKYVVHTHPAIVNGLSCGKDGEKLCGALFNGAVLWIPLTKPGYILASVCAKRFNGFYEANGEFPKQVILQNHGLFAASDTVEEIDALTENIMNRIKSRITEDADFSPLTNIDIDRAERLSAELRNLYPAENPCVIYNNCSLLSLNNYIKPFTPDHIVYCKHTPLILNNIGGTGKAMADYIKCHGFPPRIALAEGLGFFAMGETAKEAETARLLFLDAMRIAVYAKSFGGPNPLPDDFTLFILNWEVEKYRVKQ
ncbi:MAG: class II aldolase/adducin family protein [Clostridiales bacterium]|jgi:rhamnose utilization protein RhaD (predicted bifunctional aldolase and dehydrogenase)|nr:class II aldolase/adducin family protein [Clostridiales bacterium]